MSTSACATVSGAGTLVLYIGNPIVQNDQIGLIAGSRLRSFFDGRGDVEVREFSGSPLDLIGELEGYGTAVLVDSTATGGAPVGSVRLYSESELCANSANAYPHGMGLPQAIAAARRLGLPIAKKISLIGIEVGSITIFGESPIDELTDKLEHICGRVLEIAERMVPSRGRL